MEKLNILLVSTPYIRVPPATYGGLEVVLYDLACELAKQGHKVTVAAANESSLPAGITHLPIGPEKYRVEQDWLAAEREAYEAYKSHLKDFEIVHENNWFGHCYLAKRDGLLSKLIHTHHGHAGFKTPPPVKYPNFVAISQFMAKEYRQQLGINCEVAYNPVNLDRYPFQEKKGERLLFVGRISTFKQPHVAIEVARKAGVGIDIIGGDRFVDRPDYVQRVQDLCDGDFTRYFGEVPHDLKLRYLQNAKALLIPSNMGEPFGLTAIEAMSCGTIPICLNDGALGELVENGKSGFMCNTPEEMVGAIERLPEINPKDCRARAEFFSALLATNRYVELYRKILSGQEWS